MNGTKIEGTEGSSSFLTMSFSGVGLRSFLENCTEKKTRSTLRAGARRREARKGRTLEAKPAKGKRENKGGSVAQKGDWKGHAEAKIDQANKSTGRMPWH